jgi:hypothetical protein
VAFQIKTFTAVVASMLNRMRSTTTKITDYRIGSVARTLVEAPAIEIDQLYQQMFNGIKEAIPVAVYNTFNFALQAAVPASGNIRVTITSNVAAVLVPAGTIFTPPSSPYTYISASDFTIPAGSTFVDVLANANVGGIATNIPASVAFAMNPAPAGFVSAANAAAMSNGLDTETDDQRKVRFNQYIQALQRGTVAALKYGAKTTVLRASNGAEIERVRLVSVVEPWILDNTQPIGLVNMFVHNGVGTTSSGLVTLANSVIYGYYDTFGNAVPGWKAAGVKVVLAAATEVTQNIVGSVTALAGYSSAALAITANAALANYILSLDIGAPFIEAEAIFLIMSIAGVANCTLTTPATDVTATTAQKLMPGTMGMVGV